MCLIHRMIGRFHHEKKIRNLYLFHINWQCVQFWIPVTMAMIMRKGGSVMG